MKTYQTISSLKELALVKQLLEKRVKKREKKIKKRFKKLKNDATVPEVYQLLLDNFQISNIFTQNLPFLLKFYQPLLSWIKNPKHKKIIPIIIGGVGVGLLIYFLTKKNKDKTFEPQD